MGRMTQDLSGFFRGFITGIILSALTALALALIFPSFVFRAPELTKEAGFVAAFPIIPDVVRPIDEPENVRNSGGILAAGAPAPLINPGQGPEQSPVDQMASTVNLSGPPPVVVDYNSPSLFIPGPDR